MGPGGNGLPLFIDEGQHRGQRAVLAAVIHGGDAGRILGFGVRLATPAARQHERR